MPEQRLARMRASLPDNYQFGDMHQHFWGDFPVDPVTRLYRCICGETKTLWQIFLSGSIAWPSEDWYLDPNLGWNVLEGEQH